MSANPDTSAPTGRKKATTPSSPQSPASHPLLAALGHASQNTSSPEGAKEGAWQTVPLGGIAEVKLGKMLDKAKQQTGRKFPYLRNINVRWGTVDTADVFEMHFEDDQVERFSLCAGDVLVCEGGEPGRAAVWNGHVADMKFQKAIHRVRFKVPFEARLLVYLLESLAKSGGLERRFTGSTIKHFTRESFIQLPIPLPPLPEQRRIVAEIEKQFTRLEAGVAALRRVQANLKRYRAAVLKAACEGRLVPTEAALARSPRSTKNGPPAYETGAALLARILTERRQNWQGRGQYKEPAAPAAAKLGPLPEGWTWATFEQIAERVTVGFVGSMKHEYVENGVPFLRGQNVRENRFDPEGLLCVSPEFHQKLSKSALRPGDLAVVRSGSVGVTCVIPDSLPDANCSDLVLIQRPLGFVPRYGAYYMNSLAKRHVAAGKVGVALIHFNTKSVAALAVPLPPLAEQTRIVAEVERRLSVVEELESVVTANLQRATRLRQSILQKAFSGAL